MPAPLARGIIIAASVIIAAGIAAYENPQFREWVERSREKVAMAFQSTLDDIRPPRSQRDDASMREDQDEKAEERRREARQELIERGKKLEELRRRKTKSQNGNADSDEGRNSSSTTTNEKMSPSFDSLVDEEGMLRSNVAVDPATALTSAVETVNPNGTLRSRHPDTQSEIIAQTSDQSTNVTSALHESVDAPMLLRHLSGSAAQDTEPDTWESQYEREMRNTWHIPLPNNRTPTASTHASESLINLTPTTEDFPDPDYSIPSETGSYTYSESQSSQNRAEYFPTMRTVPTDNRASTLASASASASVTMDGSDSESSYYYAHPSSPSQPLQPRYNVNIPSYQNNTTRANTIPNSSTASQADSGSNIAGHMADFDSVHEDDSDNFSEFADGIRTPASAWTEVGSTISASDAEEMRQ